MTAVVSAPAISNLSPSSYPASNSNQTLLINGSNFQSGATVTFHDPQGTPYARTPTSVSSSQLSNQFDDNSDVGTWTVFVTNPDTQTSNTCSFSVTAVAAAPSISNLSPSSYPSNNDNQTMTINGSNFQSGATLNFVTSAGNTIPSNASKLTLVSSSQISYQFNDGSTPGTWSVTVVNPDTQQSSPYSFSVTAVAAAPSISYVSPTSFPPSSSNQTLNIYGTNFESGATLTFVPNGGTPIPSTASKLAVVSGGQITYLFNDGNISGTWTVQVNNPDGGVSGTANITVTAVSTTYTLGADFNADAKATDWSRETSGGRSFLFIKASQGNNPASFLPSTMSTVSPITSAFTFGVYDFADPDEYANPSTRVADPSNTTAVVADAQAAANRFYNIAGAYLTANHLLPALDVEDDGTHSTGAGQGGFNSPNDALATLPQWSWSEIAEWVAAWTTQLKNDDSALSAPILYMPMGYARNISPQLIDSYLSSPISYPLWIADINNSPNVDPSPSIGSWPTWAIEQYDQNGPTPPGDLDALNLSTPLSTLEIGHSAALSPPTTVTTTPLANECQLSWSGATGADSYQVWRNTTSNLAAATQIASGITSTTYPDVTAIPGTPYYYWVVAANGSQVSTPSAPAIGTANSGASGVTTLGPLELVSASGNATQIGFVPATGQSFEPLLTVSGTVSYDNSNISVSGTVSADIGNLGLPVLSGSFQIPVGQTATSPNTVNDKYPSSNEEIAGLSIQITSLALIPAGSGAPSPEIELEGQVSLPFGTAIEAGVLITSQGLQFENASLALPPANFAVAGLGVSESGMSVGYDATNDELVIQGQLTLQDMIQGESMTVDLTGDTNGISNGIIVKGSTVNLAGTMLVNEFTLPGGWGLTDCRLTFDTAKGNYDGAATLVIPDVFNIDVTFGLVSGHLNALSVGLSNLGDKAPLGDTGLFLNGATGGVSGLAPAAGPLTFTGDLDFTFGPDETITLPSWLGPFGGTIHTDLADLDLTGSISTQSLTGSGNLSVADGLATGTADATYDFASRNFTASTNVDIAGIYSGTSNLTVSNGDLVLAGKGQVSLPLSKICFFLHDVGPLAGGGSLLNLDTADLSRTYFDAWGTVLNATLGGRINFDGSLPSLLNAQTIPQIDPPANALFAVASGIPWALFDANWTAESSTVSFEIQTPDGSIYTASNLPGYMSVVSSTSTQVTLQVFNPTAGNWSLILPDADGLGTVSFAALGGTPASGVHLGMLQASGTVAAGASLNPVAIVGIEDENGNLANSGNSQVTLTMADGSGNTVAVLNAQAVDGIATFAGVAPQNAGNYTLTATDGADASAVATLTVTTSLVPTISFVQGPTSIVASDSIAPAITVQAKDQYGNVISGDTVTLAIESYPSGSVSNTFIATTDSSGIAAFAGVSLATAGTYAAVATAGAVSTGSSSTFVVSPAAASKLVFSQQPSNVPAGAVISPNLVVDVEDPFGNLVVTDNSNVALSLNGEGTLNGTPAVQAQNGVATFSGLSVNGAGIYTISAGDGSLAAISTAFAISRATPTVALASPPPSITYDGTSDVTKWAIPNVSGVSGMANPTGLPNVVFYGGNSPAGTPLASAPVNPGTYTAVASYSGDANYGAASSAPVIFNIGPRPLVPGVSTVGLFAPSASAFLLDEQSATRNSVVAFGYGWAPAAGEPALIPLTGDWTGSGVTTIGLFDPASGTFFLHNSNSGGYADMTFGYGWVPAAGQPALIPLSGDWTGDGVTSIGLYDPATSTFFLRNSNTAGVADETFCYGWVPAAGQRALIPVTGNWTGTSVTYVGLYDPASSMFFLRDSNTAGVADATFPYGPAGCGWTPLAGDWTGSGTDTVGLYDPANSTFFLRNSNTAGVADSTFSYGMPGTPVVPLAGNWTGATSAPAVVPAAALHSASVTSDAGLAASALSSDTFGTSAPVAPPAPAAVYQQTLSPQAVDQADLAAVAEQTLSSLTGLAALNSSLDDLALGSLGSGGQAGPNDIDAVLAGYGAG